MRETRNNNSKFATTEEISANRADREGILLREGILFSAELKLLRNSMSSKHINVLEERKRVFTHLFGRRYSLNFSSMEWFVPHPRIRIKGVNMLIEINFDSDGALQLQPRRHFQGGNSLID